MRVYHFLNDVYGPDAIRRRRLKIARINELNDPFEFLAVESGVPEVRRAFQKVKDQQHQGTGILCFARSWRNPVMWSHYANRHKGLCLGFDVPDELLTEVEYRSKRTKPNLPLLVAGGEAAASHMQKLLTTKFSHWRYERESRVFVRLDPTTEDENSLYFYDFSDQMKLSEVIVGINCTVSRTELSNALGDLATSIKCKKARLAFKTFGVVTQRRSSLWV